MRVYRPRSDFVIVEGFFTASDAHAFLALIQKLGAHSRRGFHHPDLKPSRFHPAPKYPVKKYMCLGLYWNPLDYRYHSRLPNHGNPHPIPDELKDLCTLILEEFYPYPDFDPQSVLVNFYTHNSSMGLHVDKDEEERVAPVIGLNFGSSARFYYEDERGEIKDLKIPGNSIYIFGRSARQMRHGLGSIYAKTLSEGSEGFLENKERLNLTIRQVFKKD